MHGTSSSPSYAPAFESTHVHPSVWPAPTGLAPPRSASLPLKPSSLLGAFAGLLGLGAAASLGAFDMIAGLKLIPSVLLVEVGSLALTTPALLAMHQFLGLHASVEDLASALARALVRGGQVAAGLAVVVISFALTTDLAIPALVAALLAVGVFTSVVGCVELSSVERRASTHALRGSEEARRASSAGARSPTSEEARFTLLLLGWSILSWAIALRIGVHVARWVMGY